MANYTVRFNYRTYVEIEVNADNAKEALEKAEDEVWKRKYEADILENREYDRNPEITNDDTGAKEDPEEVIDETDED